MTIRSLAIVGAGPRGLSIVERLAAVYAEQSPRWRLDVHLIDPKEPGQGAHSARQPDYLLTNTVAGQITLFTDASVQNAGPLVSGPTLQEWANSAGYRRVDGRFVRTRSDGDPIQENDYLPRALLGEYLTFVYDRVSTSLPHNLRLIHHRALADNIETEGAGRYRVTLSGGSTIYANCVVLTTGHTRNAPDPEALVRQAQVRRGRQTNPKLRLFTSVEPSDVLEEVDADAHVLVQGMGLTAYDVVSALTVGRGGRFVGVDERRLRYEPSGREPRLILASRQGLPFSARAVNQKGLAGLYRPNFFTRPWIDRIRQEKRAVAGSPQFDYETDLAPTLFKEMCFVYDMAVSTDSQLSPIDYEPEEATRRAIETLFSPLGTTAFENQREFDAIICAHILRDIDDAFGGNVENAKKAASDVLRDLRDHIRYAVDYGGLTEASHRRFLSEVVPSMYRLSAGAPKERNIEMLALLDSGIATLAPGPSPIVEFAEREGRFLVRSTKLQQSRDVFADVLVRARLDCVVHPDSQQESLVSRLVGAGIVRPFSNSLFRAGGIDVDSSQRVIDATGRVSSDIWALGILTEGANFCTYVLPRTLVNSRFLQFSGRCAIQIFDRLQECDDEKQEPAKSTSTEALHGSADADSYF